MVSLKGSLWALVQYDVSEEIRIEEVRRLWGAQSPGRGPEFRGPSPEYVKFAQAPLVSPAVAVELTGEGIWSCTVKVYDYGVVSIALELGFESDWDGLVRLANRWIGSADLERKAAEMAKSQVQRIHGALFKPYTDWIFEDYYVVHLREANGEIGGSFGPGDDLRLRRPDRPDRARRSRRIIQPRASGDYPAMALLLSDRSAGGRLDGRRDLRHSRGRGAGLAASRVRQHAVARVPLLRQLADRGAGGRPPRPRAAPRNLGRWRIATEAERLNRVRLDVIELTERIDNSIKFLSDMFYARVYRRRRARSASTTTATWWMKS